MVAAVAGVAASCSGTSKPVPVEPPDPITKVQPDDGGTPVFDFPTGTFAVKKQSKVMDNCRTMGWETEHIEIDPVAGTLWATPDNRLFQIQLDAGDLVGKGTFTQREKCPNDQYVEIWRLVDKGSDVLSGYVTTYMRVEDTDCSRACKAVFSVEVARVDEK